MAQPDRPALDPEFVGLVRSALSHLYDHAYLQNHPLVSCLAVQKSLDGLTRAQELRRILLESIEQLATGSSSDSQNQSARAYAVLSHRYVDGLSMEEIGNELGLSQRSLYREYKKGLEAVASLLWDLMQGAEKQDATPVIANDRAQVVRAELNHLRPALQLQPVELGSVLQDTLSMLGRLVGGIDARVVLDSPQKWPTLMADRVTLRQALLSVLNYLLHAVHGTLTIRIGQDELVVQVGDPVDDLTPVLSELQSSPLAVAQALIEAQGGRLVVSVENTFWQIRIHLPSPARPIILMVEDNADTVTLFRRYLVAHHITVIAAANGAQAMQLATELQPQLITLDVMMPGEDGWEILQKLKEAPATRHIPVVVCSVLQEPALALSMGASDYVTKPLERVALLNLLQRYLGSLLPAQ